MRSYPPESDEGNIEYKLFLTSWHKEKIEKLATQIKYRVNEGGGEAIYVLGVSDDGKVMGLSSRELEASVKLLDQAAERVGVTCTLLRVEEVRRGRFVAQLLLRRGRGEHYPICLRIPVLGNVDSGKSTLVGVLVSGSLDDGRGRAMAQVARYLHEIQSGRTSSVNYRLLGFDEAGNIINYEIDSPLNEAEIYLRSSKVITFVDLAGHERYLKTTLKGILGNEDDYVMFLVAANAGFVGMAKEHFGIAVALKLPVFIVISKIDMVAGEVRRRVVREAKRIVKLPGIDRLPMLIRSMDDVIIASRHMPSGRVVPIFQVSNVTGEGLDLLRAFLNLLPPRLRWEEKRRGRFKLYIDEKFNVPGVGTVVSGLVVSGELRVGERVYLGPWGDGDFRLVKVKSIHVNRVSVDRVSAGQDAALAITDVGYEEVLKGMVLIVGDRKPRPTHLFEAKVTILHHPTMIREGYQAVVHLHTIRQAVRFEAIEKGVLRSGDTSRVLLRFMYRPEYVEPGDRFVFREGRTRGLGRVIRIVG